MESAKSSKGKSALDKKPLGEIFGNKNVFSFLSNFPSGNPEEDKD